MEILLWCDMEGVSGIQSWEHTGGSSALYDEGRRLYTAEVGAAVRGCRAGGAISIIAQDGHGGAYPGGKGFVSWIPDRLEPGAEYVRGYRWARFVEPLVAGTCDAVGFVGAHSAAGTEFGVLSHTVNADGWYRVLLNGAPIGEVGILAAIAGSFGRPAVCIAGDQAACDELEMLVGADVVKAPVKRGYGRYAARMLAPADACALIEARFAEAVSERMRWPQPFVPAQPATITVELASPDRACAYGTLDGVALIDPRTVEATGPTFWDAWSKIWRDG